MTEIFYNLMHPLPNAIMTALMAVLVIYWLFVFLFGFGVDDLDLGIDFDVDVPEADLDADIEVADPEHEVAAEKSPGFFMKFLNFMNVGRIPFMLVFTTFKFFVWIGSLITTSLINVTSWGVSSVFILIPLAIIAVFFTKYATNPMVRFFKEIGYQGEEAIDFLGRSGKMLSSIKDDKVGVAEFMVESNPIRLNVKSQNGDELKYGEYVVVMDEMDDKNCYLVSKEISLRNF